MKIGIYCGVDAGLVKDRLINYIAVDKGVSFLLKQNIKPLLVIGDMDSLEDIHLLDDLHIQRYNPIKDDTDTALAIDYALKLGYDEIDLYGVTQKRMDHYMAVLALLEKYQDIKIVIYDEWNKIQVLKKGTHQIPKDGFQYFSLFAFDESVISIHEAHYPLDHYHLKRTDPLCVSNQMNDDYAIIETSNTILFMQSK